MKQARESNFELLRMLAMLGVMALHAGFYGDVPPPRGDGGKCALDVVPLCLPRV